MALKIQLVSLLYGLKHRKYDLLHSFLCLLLHYIYFIQSIMKYFWEIYFVSEMHRLLPVFTSLGAWELLVRPTPLRNMGLPTCLHERAHIFFLYRHRHLTMSNICQDNDSILGGNYFLWQLPMKSIHWTSHVQRAVSGNVKSTVFSQFVIFLSCSSGSKPVTFTVLLWQRPLVNLNASIACFQF